MNFFKMKFLKRLSESSSVSKIFGQNKIMILRTLLGEKNVAVFL